jgi:fructose-1,6-bisphosphatase/inositol monophosphatase family enzyme
MCLLAAGDYIASPGRGRLWDFAAGVLLMQEAGGFVELTPSIEHLDVAAYAASPESRKIFQMFARANEQLPSLQFLLGSSTAQR